MADTIRKAAVLGYPDKPDTRTDLEMVRSRKTAASGTLGRPRTKGGGHEPVSIINSAVESVMDLIDGLHLFAPITRGALGTGAGLSCEVAPSSPSEVYMDKNKFIPVDLTINGKHTNLETLSDAMNGIHESLTMMKSYPYGEDWAIVDISTYTEPQIVEREESNAWFMASSLSVKIQTMKE